MKQMLPAMALAAAVAAALSFASARAQIARPDRGVRSDPGQAVRVYEGVSQRGSFQDALDDAVARALRSLPGADRMVRYRVREITGEQGGIRGANTVRVSIEVSDEGRRGAPAELGVEEPIQDRLRAALRPELTVSPAEVDRSGSTTFTLRVLNTSDEAVQVPINTGQRYDFEVWRDNRRIWRWSEGRLFSQVLTNFTIPAGGAVTHRETWNLRNSQGARVPAGRYEVRAYLRSTADDLRITATAPLNVTGR